MTNLTIMQLADDVAIAEFKKLPETVVCIDGKEAVRYTPERTCQQVDVTARYQPYVTYSTACSSCDGMLALDEFPAPNYCPNCGARVRSEA